MSLKSAVNGGQNRKAQNLQQFSNCLKQTYILGSTLGSNLAKAQRKVMNINNNEVACNPLKQKIQFKDLT